MSDQTRPDDRPGGHHVRIITNPTPTDEIPPRLPPPPPPPVAPPPPLPLSPSEPLPHPAPELHHHQPFNPQPVVSVDPVVPVLLPPPPPVIVAPSVGSSDAALVVPCSETASAPSRRLSSGSKHSTYNPGNVVRTTPPESPSITPYSSPARFQVGNDQVRLLQQEESSFARLQQRMSQHDVSGYVVQTEVTYDEHPRGHRKRVKLNPIHTMRHAAHLGSQFSQTHGLGRHHHRRSSSAAPHVRRPRVQSEQVVPNGVGNIGVIGGKKPFVLISRKVTYIYSSSEFLRESAAKSEQKVLYCIFMGPIESSLSWKWLESTPQMRRWNGANNCGHVMWLASQRKMLIIFWPLLEAPCCHFFLLFPVWHFRVIEYNTLNGCQHYWE